jgi:hypothetical protein
VKKAYLMMSTTVSDLRAEVDVDRVFIAVNAAVNDDYYADPNHMTSNNATELVLDAVRERASAAYAHLRPVLSSYRPQHVAYDNVCRHLNPTPGGYITTCPLGTWNKDWHQVCTPVEVELRRSGRHR